MKPLFSNVPVHEQINHSRTNFRKPFASVHERSFSVRTHKHSANCKFQSEQVKVIQEQLSKEEEEEDKERLTSAQIKDICRENKKRSSSNAV